MKEPKFRGYDTEQNKWVYGYGWFKVDYTEEYKKEKGITDTALLHTYTGSTVECPIESMGEFTDFIWEGEEVYSGDLFKVEELTFKVDPENLGEELNVRFYKGSFQLYRGEENLMDLSLHYLKKASLVGTAYEKYIK